MNQYGCKYPTNEKACNYPEGCKRPECNPPRKPDYFHTDDLSIYLFSIAMRNKMDIGRKKHGDDWRSIPMDRLRIMLAEHVIKGDPVDIANFAMFIWEKSQANQQKLG